MQTLAEIEAELRTAGVTPATLEEAFRERQLCPRCGNTGWEIQPVRSDMVQRGFIYTPCIHRFMPEPARMWQHYRPVPTHYLSVMGERLTHRQ